MSDESYDLAIIGAGPGGYVAAIRAGQLGLKTVCIDRRPDLGGTCLNVGCIPSKALLQSSENWASLMNHGEIHGIEAKGLKHNFAKMMERKEGIVKQFRQGIKGLFRKNKVTPVHGHAKLLSATEISVSDPKTGKETQKLQAKNIILATGSDSVHLPFLPVDEEQVVTSTGALSLKKVPKRLVVIGGGVIGVEMASVYQRLGSEVHVVEMLDMICPGMDMAVRKGLHGLLQKQGMEFHLSTKVLGAKVGKRSTKVEIETKDGKKSTLDADVVLVSVGRRPYSEGLGLEEVGVKTNERGFVEIDGQFRTSVANIYAIGDLVPGAMLAHKASEEGVAVVEMLAGKHPHVNYLAIPGVVYTAPEAASVGFTEEEARGHGLDISVGQFPFKASSRARCVGEDEGFVKIIGDKKSGRLLGMHILGHMAGELIATGVFGLERKGLISDLCAFPAAHPTLSEALKEAAMMAENGKAIHI